MTGTREFAVGDINSIARGSGARDNADKVQWDLIPLASIEKLWCGDLHGTDDPELEVIREILHFLRGWQEGKTFWVDHAVAASYAYAESAVHVLVYGKKKYAPWNWAKGMQWSVCLGCVLRHIRAILDGEDFDEESGQLHMGHVLANLIMLQHYSVNYPEGDDRPNRSCFLANEVVQFTKPKDLVAEELEFDNEYDELLAIRRGEWKEEGVGL